MRFNSPIARTGMPHFQEASPQRSPRDADVTARQWIKDKDIGKQLAWLTNAVQQQQRYLERARLFKPLGSGSGQVQVFRLKEVHPDYLLCHPFDEFSAVDTNSGILIAKEYKHRCSDLYPGSDGSPITVMGVDHTYTYTDNIDANGINNVTRTDSFSSTTEDQRIVPPWVLDDVIYAMPFPTIVVDDTTTPHKTANLIYIPGSRQWAQI